MTLASFYTHVLRELGVVPPNGTAEPEDRQRVVDKYPLVHAMLLKNNLAWWGVAESLPDEAVIPAGKIVAFALTPDFAVSPEQYLVLKSEGELNALPPSLSERQLRKLITREYIAAPIVNEFF